MKRYIVYIASLIISVLPAAAGEPGFEALPFLRLSRDPSAVTGGGAQVFASGAYSVFTNPALPFSSDKGVDVALSYARWGASGSNEIDFGGAYRLSDRFSLSLGFSYGMNPAYDVYNKLGALTGTFTPSDMIAGLGAGFRVTDALTLGANVKYASSKLSEAYSYSAVAGDVFAAMEFSGLIVTAGVSTLGTPVESQKTGKYSLPSSAAFGLGYGTAAGEALELRAQLTADYYFSGALAAGAGAEAVIKDMVSLRFGYDYGGESVIPSHATAGIGLHLSGFRLDAKLLAGKDAGTSMLFGASYSF